MTADPDRAPSDMSTYINVGAGVFGASTAYHLIKKFPKASNTLVDRTLRAHEAAASWDWQKVVRADYEDKFYTRLGLEALDAWTDDKLYSPFFHRSGMVWIMPDPNFPKLITDNYRSVGRELKWEIIKPAEPRQRWGGAFADADLDGVNDMFFNPESGCADATPALNAVIDSAIEAGAKNVAMDVARIIYDGDRCVAVQDASGTGLQADHIILCTGAYTPKLLADSATHREELQMRDNLRAAAVLTGLLHLDDVRCEKLANAPILINDIGKTMGQYVPCCQFSSNTLAFRVLTLPGDSATQARRNAIKLNRDLPLQNTVVHQATNQRLSMPPARSLYDEWAPPASLTQELEITSKGLFEGLDFEGVRLCWESIAPDVDFIIAPHPHSPGLYIATGGSYRGWKFLPILGKYVVQMLTGTMDPGYAERWKFEKPKDSPSTHKGWLPDRELGDFT